MDIAIYSFLTWYFDNVIYSKRPLWFFVTPSYWCGGKRGRNVSQNKDDSDEEYEVEGMDEDVIKERELIRLNQVNDEDNTLVILENLQKTYKGTQCFCVPDKDKTFRAVKGIDFTIKDGQLFCLLGHNGAGKTTTIGMLTGLFPCTGGDASIFGYSITTDMSEIRTIMGVCPQHDILWKSLTAEEHLQLFASLRGIPEDQIDEEVNQRLEDVDLADARHGLAGDFSGGMQRRLSVAIALIGNPKIVFLDEPTTGMDPISRRKVWNLIERVKRDRVILLTTHSMEEADILGDKIAIMKEGRIATIGTSLHLKNKFGKGFDISIVTKDKNNIPNIKEFVTKNLIHEEQCVAVFNEELSKLGVLKFNISRDHSALLPKFFRKLEKKKSSLGVADFQVNLSTLEQVFISVAATEHTEKK
jgi:ABC-type multidrug transport system ATPase subunit